MVGNVPNFNKYDILRCFFAVDEGISRQELVNELELGEGTVRSILDVLKTKDLINSTRQGHTLSDKGKKLFDEINDKMMLPQPITTDYYKDKPQSFILMRNNTVEIKIEQRDKAIKQGADAALILEFDGEKLTSPNCEESFKDLEAKFNFEKNDLIIICFADDERTAENACLAVAETFYIELTENF